MKLITQYLLPEIKSITTYELWRYFKHQIFCVKVNKVQYLLSLLVLYVVINEIK